MIPEGASGVPGLEAHETNQPQTPEETSHQPPGLSKSHPVYVIAVGAAGAIAAVAALAHGGGHLVSPSSP